MWLVLLFFQGFKKIKNLGKLRKFKITQGIFI